MLDVLIGLRQQSNEYFDLIIADPPYNIGKDFGDCKDNMDIASYLDWCDEWIDECKRVLKPSGTIYIYGFSETLAHISARLKIPHRWLIWHYENKTVPKLSFWQRSHESILCCWVDKSKRIFNQDSVRVPYTDVFLKNAAGKVRKGTKGRYSHDGKETVYEANEKGALPRDVLKVPALAGGAGASERWFLCRSCNQAYPNKKRDEHEDHDVIQHPTQKPYELTKRLLMASKPHENGKVLIPFIGTGSEAAVAEDLGMEYLGFEINPDYVKLAESYLLKRKGDTYEQNDDKARIE